jgi:hypothetical protein
MNANKSRLNEAITLAQKRLEVIKRLVVKGDLEGASEGARMSLYPELTTAQGRLIQDEAEFWRDYSKGQRGEVKARMMPDEDRRKTVFHERRAYLATFRDRAVAATCHHELCDAATAAIAEFSRIASEAEVTLNAN